MMWKMMAIIVALLLTPCLAALTTQPAFIHPGLLHTEADFVRVRAKVQAGEEPWKSGWDVLVANPHANLGWRARPTDVVVRGNVPGQNVAAFFNDVHAAYQLALRWKVSGDPAYADKSIEILNAWSSVLKEVRGNADRFLAAGLQGYQFANAAEIIRGYRGWKPEDLQRFQKMMLEVFYPMNETFLLGREGGKDHNGAAITNYWANWDLCNVASMMAIGVLCDRRDIYDRAIDYFKHGRGNGSIERAIYYVHSGNLGQPQEAGRDQGHTTMCIAVLSEICQMAWNQGDDLFGYDNNRLLAGAEYVARYNLGHEVPFQEYAWGTGQGGDRRTQTTVAEGSRGSARPGWELLMNHYVNRKGIAAPYSVAFAAKVRPEGGGGNYGPNSGGFDQLGFGTLTATLDPIATVGVPTGLTARLSGSSVVLNWWGVPNAVRYNVKRADSMKGPFTTVASDITDLLTYADENPTTDKCYYVVTAVMPNGDETRPSQVAVVSTVPELIFKLDKEKDTSLRNGATWSGDATGRAVQLDGVDDCVALPDGIVKELGDFTISAWVRIDEAATWSRVFDFGKGTGAHMFLTPRSGTGNPRFAVSTVYGYNEQVIDSEEPFPTGRPVHVAVTLSGRTGTLYIDGKKVGTNLNIDFPPFRLGVTTQDWIGRSQFEHDPYLKGNIAGFHIYSGAMSAEDVAKLAISDRQ